MYIFGKHNSATAAAAAQFSSHLVLRKCICVIHIPHIVMIIFLKVNELDDDKFVSAIGFSDFRWSDSVSIAIQYIAQMYPHRYFILYNDFVAVNYFVISISCLYPKLLSFVPHYP